VEVLGRRWSDSGPWLRERIGITLQETRLPDKLAVREILALFRSFYRQGRTVEEVIRLVSLEEKAGAWYEKLSGGQKQRLAVACALVGDPELLFLDEPTTGLDPQSRRQLWEVIGAMRAEGRTVLLTTHYMDEAERLCDRVAVVDHGKVIALGTPRELIERVVGHEVVEFAAPDAGARLEESRLQALPGVRAVRRRSGSYALTVERVHLTVPALLQHLDEVQAPLENLVTHTATLEDVFVTLTGRRLRD
jgi:ABC-2 type transport system ATP-binding protein